MYYVRSYKSIFITFLRYLPSRLLVVINSFIIVPVLARLLTVQEVGIFQLLLGVLNLVCTCSTDWISKSVLRFYEKYNLANKLDDFFSNTLAISVIVYLIILLLYFCMGNFIAEKFLIQKNLLFITMILVIPVGFRQFLYQMLRIFNKPFLYTLSIIIYQISMLVLFLIFTGYLPNVVAALFAMAVAIIFIDIYLMAQLSVKIKISFRFNYDIMSESLKYALPQIITNTSVWAILNVHRFVAQWNGLYELTAVIGLSNMLISSALMPIFSLFIFALFPIYIRKYEMKADVSQLLTDSIRLYSVMFLPIALIFYFFGKDISDIVFVSKFENLDLIIGFYAVGIFFHEMMKLFNIKYHLKNKMNVEMGISIFMGAFCLILSSILIPKYGAIGAGITLLTSILVLILCHSFVKFEHVSVNYFLVIRTILQSALICFIAYSISFMLFIPQNIILFDFIRIAIYVFISYMLTGFFAKNLLE